jgi:hypothetical protein
MDQLESLRDWLVRISGDEWVWFAKRLSANDTGLTGSHQVGFYVPRTFALAVAPELAEDRKNPDRDLTFTLFSHDQVATPRLIYYNSRVFEPKANGRNEFRVTRFGGRQSALQDPESTGAILVTAWDTSGASVEAWLAETYYEEDLIETVLGPVDPGTQVIRLVPAPGQPQVLVAAPAPCDPDITDLPLSWAEAFPPGRELTDAAFERRPSTGSDADKRLLDRYRCEFGLFKVVEAAHVLPLVTAGFPSVDEFLTVAQTVANRRKSRAGRSLELHLAKIFDEEGVAYETGGTTEGNRKPDFVFPSIDAYHAGEPTLMLGVKTSVKERWRQVIDEAARIPQKHLFTLSEGVSPDQFDQMQGAGLRLVVPSANMDSFPAAIRPQLLTLADFVAMVSERV